MNQLPFTTLLWSAAVAVVGVLAIVLLQRYHRRANTALRRRIDQLEEELRRRDEEAEHLVAVLLPTVAEPAGSRPDLAPPPRHAQLTGTAFARSLEQVTGLFTEVGEKALARADQSAKAVLQAAMKTVQGLAREQQAVIAGLQNDHDDPEVLEGLLEIDHANSQLIRRAQAIGVLCGSWAGQQRSAASLTDVVRGAISRVRHYLRITLHDHSDTAVVSWVVEPVVLTLAELLDNATRYSPPTTSVEVNFQNGANGVGIVVDDAGVGMDAEARQVATRLLSAGRRAVDLTSLGDPPQVGFAVMGVLAARYGFTVSVDTVSPYGGVRAVLFVPSALLTQNEPAVPVDEAPGPQQVEAEIPTTVGGLPKRRRRKPATEPLRQPSAAAASPRAAEDTAAGLFAWQRGTLSGRESAPTESEGSSQP